MILERHIENGEYEKFKQSENRPYDRKRLSKIMTIEIKHTKAVLSQLTDLLPQNMKVDKKVSYLVGNRMLLLSMLINIFVNGNLVS